MKRITGLRSHVLLVQFLLIAVSGMAQVTEEWVARFATSLTSFDERATDMTIDEQGNVYVTGTTIGTGTSFDYTTIKYNTAGVLQWVNRYNGTGNGFDEPTAIAVDELGNVYVTGNSEGIGSGSDYATIKLNTAGVIQWVTRYNGPGNAADVAHDIAVDENGNVYVTGESTGDGTNLDYATIKHSSVGAILWITRYNGPGNSIDRAQALAIDNSNVYVTGQSEGDGTGLDYATIKHDQLTGAIVWVSRFNGAGNDFDNARSITVDNSGNVYVTGTSTSGFISGDPFDIPLLDYATIKYNAVGAQQWVAIHDEAGGDDFAVSVMLDNQGNVYVTGSVSNSPAGVEDPDQDYGTVKYTSDGILLWVAKYGPPPGQEFNAFSATDQAIDSEGNVYVTGQGGQQDFTTVRFNNNGTLQWAVSYKVGENQTAIGVEVDASGNVYVSGSSSRVNCLGCFDFATIKYSQLQTACGKKGDKVLVCHKGKVTLCINKDDVAAHIGHGDQLGDCAAASTITARESQPDNIIPVNFKVSVVPNPAAVTTRLYYQLPLDGRVSITIYDMLGRRIKTLVDASKPAGFHSTDFNVAPIPAGIYTYQIMVKSARKKYWSQTGKISVIK
jgi:hypothetical protein